VQRWHTIRGALSYIYGTLGGAYRIGPVSVGLAANLVSARVETLRAYSPTADTLPHTDQEARADLEFSEIVGSFGAGVLVEVIAARLWLAASYQAQPGLGVMELPGTLVVTYQGVARKDDVVLHQALPDVVRLGGRFRASSDIEFRMFGDLTRWSLLQTQCVALAGHPCVVAPSGADAGDGGVFWNIRRNWRDTVSLRAGGSHWIHPELELFAGLGFETAATPDETLEPELPDSLTLQGAFGARWELAGGLFLSGSYTHLYYLPRNNVGKSELSAADVPTRRPDGGGEYEQWISVFNANLEATF
jgi:long-chain fatty acid transport protein